MAQYGRPIAAFWREEMPPFLRSLAILTALGLTVAALYAKAGVGAVLLLFVPLFAAQYMFKLLVREKEHLAIQKELSDKYLEMNVGLAAAMVVLLDSKDEYTAQHSAAVAMYCRDIATALNLPDDERTPFISQASFTTSARSGSRMRSFASRPSSTRRNGRSSGSILRKARKPSRISRPTKASPTSCSTTTSGWTAVGTRGA